MLLTKSYVSSVHENILSSTGPRALKLGGQVGKRPRNTGGVKYPFNFRIPDLGVIFARKVTLMLYKNGFFAFLYQCFFIDSLGV